jgi:hypothetical protein
VGQTVLVNLHGNFDPRQTASLGDVQNRGLHVYLLALVAVDVSIIHPETSHVKGRISRVRRTLLRIPRGLP